MSYGLWIVVKDYEGVAPALKPLLSGDDAAAKGLQYITAGMQLSEFLADEQGYLKYPTLPIIFAMNDGRGGDVFVDLVTKKEEGEEKRPVPKVAWVHSLYAGLDAFRLHRLSKEQLAQFPITNAHGVFSYSLAEYTLYAAMYFIRGTSRLQANKAARVWKQTGVPLLRDLQVGILGYGSIGKECGRIFKNAFGSKVLGWRRTVTEPIDDIGTSVVSGDEGFDAVLDSDIVISVLPKTESTIRILNSKAFQKMRRNTIFISIGRGACVHEDELVTALTEDVIAGAALDVFETEPLPKESTLYSVPDSKILLTPHDADYNTGVRDLLAAESFAKDIQQFIESDGSLSHMPHFVDVSKGY